MRSSAMKLADALLLDVSPTKNLTGKLRGILETAFTVTVSPNAWNISHSLSALHDELTQSIGRADAGLIFLASPQGALDQSKSILSTLKAIVPEVPVIAALEQ